MKLAIYGDSFGFAYPGAKSEKFLWCNLLAEKLNGTIKNFCAVGSGVYGCYEEFLKTYHDFDLCIFLVTEPNRYYKTIELAGRKRFMSGMGQIEFYRKNFDLTPGEKQQLDWLEGWYMCSEPMYNRRMTDFILDDIQRKKPNTVIYPCFENSLNPRYINEKILSFKEFLNHQLIALKINTENFDILNYENYDNISAHFAEPYNVFIADMFYKKITTNVYDITGLDNIKLDKSVSYYNQSERFFRFRDKINESNKTN